MKQVSITQTYSAHDFTEESLLKQTFGLQTSVVKTSFSSFFEGGGGGEHAVGAIQLCYFFSVGRFPWQQSVITRSTTNFQEVVSILGG